MFVDLGNIRLVGQSQRIQAGVENDNGGGNGCHEHYEENEGGDEGIHNEDIYIV